MRRSLTVGAVFLVIVGVLEVRTAAGQVDQVLQDDAGVAKRAASFVSPDMRLTARAPWDSMVVNEKGGEDEYQRVGLVFVGADSVTTGLNILDAGYASILSDGVAPLTFGPGIDVVFAGGVSDKRRYDIRFIIDVVSGDPATFQLLGTFKCRVYPDQSWMEWPSFQPGKEVPLTARVEKEGNGPQGCVVKLRRKEPGLWVFRSVDLVRWGL